jgi:hypothetical protein
VRSRNVKGFAAYSNEVQILAAQTPDQPTLLQNDAANTNSEQISLTWVAPAFTGGSPITGYQLWYAEINSVWQVYQSAIVTPASIVSGLSQGV